jgi:sucrose-6F-phosphate phosphohydrolase
MVARRLLVSDLDGTLLGDDAALERFRVWIAAERSVPASRHGTEWRLVYATGRSLTSVQGLVADALLPAPDAIVTDVGTLIHDPTGVPWPGWPTWSADSADIVDAARRRLSTWPGVSLQEAANQSPWKASFEVMDFDAQALGAVRRALQDDGLAASVVYSHDRFLDVLPVEAGKAAAARFLATAWSIPPDRVVAAGDSGNDLDLLTAGFRAIVVANGHPEVLALDHPDIYRSNLGHADGVLEGIRHWTAQPTR